MPKEEWGVKRVCPTTGKRFYDLNRNPIVSPYTNEVVELDTSKTRMIAADAEDMSSKALMRRVMRRELLFFRRKISKSGSSSRKIFFIKSLSWYLTNLSI